jgi:two-component system sensor histidine kinase RegB
MHTPWSDPSARELLAGWTATRLALWGTLAGVALMGRLLLALTFPLLPVLVCTALGAASSLIVASRAPAIGPHATVVLGVATLLDTALLTLLLAMTAGPANPFSAFYLVLVVLAAMVLPRAWALAASAVSIAGFALLFVVHVPVEGLSMHHHGSAPPPASRPILQSGPEGERLAPGRPADDHAAHDPHAHHHAPRGPAEDKAPDLHLMGMLVAYALTALLLALAVGRIRSGQDRLQQALRRAEARQREDLTLQALGSLAAGAAHELATPLSVIAMAAEEWAHLPPTDEAQRQQEAESIRSEVVRCRAILHDMAAGTGYPVHPDDAVDSVAALVRQVLHGFPGADRIRVDLPDDGLPVRWPLRAMARTLRSLLDNALRAGPGEVRVVAFRQGDHATLRVEDDGDGMAADVLRQAGQPFFSTRPAGQGTGLGLFASRAVVRHLGGSVTLDSTPGHGTRAVLEIPVLPPGPEHAPRI